MNILELNPPKMSSFQTLMVTLCFILNFSDGIDVLIVSFSSSEIIEHWGLSNVEMGYIFSMGLAGMTLGCFFLAPLADHFGRRKVFLASVALITIGLFGVALTDNYLMMLSWRFLTGFGIGGIIPTMTATAAEYSSSKYRDFNVGLVQAGWPVGAIIIGLVCAKYIPVFGWKFAFLVSGFFSLGIFALVYFLMTDSMEFMLKNPKNDTLTKVNQLRIKMELVPFDILPTLNETTEVTSYKTLFTPAFKDSTIKSWIAAFFGFLTLYTLMSWVPEIAKNAGLDFQMTAIVGIVLNLGAAIGSASIGALGGKWGMRQVQLTFMLSAFGIMLTYAFSILSPLLIVTLIFLIGLFVQGGFNGISPILSRIYPAEIRTTGMGFAIGFGRFGAILGPLIFGFLLDQGFSIQTLFILFSLPLLVMGASIWSLKSNRL